jgi:hypothetical protein
VEEEKQSSGPEKKGKNSNKPKMPGQKFNFNFYVEWFNIPFNQT